MDRADEPRTPASILRERARSLAREPESAEPPGATIEVVEFTLAHERYAIETAWVSEVHPLEDLTPLPCTPPFVLGLVNVRRCILPVIDLKKFFDLPEQGINDLHRILIMDAGELRFGILADAIAGVHRVRLDRLQRTLPTFNGLRAEYLKGVTPDRLAILDGAALTSDRRIIVHEDVES